MKPIGAEDHELLAVFAAELEEIETAGIFPEDVFEARLLLGSDARALLLRETDERHTERTQYLYESMDVFRARRRVVWLHKTYGGRCQICSFDPRARYSHRLCHGHHIQWLSRGGLDKLENMVLVCPNHHSAIHADDASFENATHAFAFSNGLTERLKLNEHLPLAG